MTQQEVFNAIAAERDYQRAKWGTTYDDRDWSAQEWMRFMLEYLPSADNRIPLRHPEYDLRTQITKVASLAVAMLEALPA